jgi:Exocyst complex component Sec5
MKKIQKCLQQIRPNFSAADEEHFISLAESFDSVRDTLVEIICKGWREVSKNFHQYENWTFSNMTAPTSQTESNEVAEGTPVCKVFSQMSSILLRSIYKISGGNTSGDDGSIESVKDAQSQQKYADHATAALFDCHYHILDGFQFLVTQFHNPDQSTSPESQRSGWVPPIINKMLKSHFPDHVDAFGIFVPLEVVKYPIITTVHSILAKSARCRYG